MHNLSVPLETNTHIANDTTGKGITPQLLLQTYNTRSQEHGRRLMLPHELRHHIANNKRTKTPSNQANNQTSNQATK